jgi:predicted nucleic-acid-binding protein
MIGLDTNVLVRYLTQDEPAEARHATAIIERAVDRGEPVLVSCIVISELVWVLRRAYGIPPPEVLATIEHLLETPQMELEDRDLVRKAVADSKAGLGDFVDSLIGRRHEAQGCSLTATFDQGLKGHPAFRFG